MEMEFKFFPRDVKGKFPKKAGDTFIVKHFFSQDNVKFTATEVRGDMVMAVRT